MKPRRVLAPRNAAETFDQAVRERALAVLTLHHNNDWHTFKSRFLERDHSGRFFVLDYQAVNGEDLPPVAPGQYVGVSFRQRSRKILFATVVEAKGHYVLDDRTSVPAIRYRWPASMTELQRRAYFRTPVPEGMALLVSLWSGGVAARAEAQATALRVVTGDLVDVSCGGALVHLHQPNPPEWAEHRTLGLELQLPDGRPPILVDGRFRGARQAPAGVPSVAVQFIALELTVEGRVALQRLASSVQCLHRLGIASGRRDWNNKPRF